MLGLCDSRYSFVNPPTTWTGVMRVVTPSPLIQSSIDIQEFLVGPGINVVPVPAGWLFGSALGMMGWLRRQGSV